MIDSARARTVGSSSTTRAVVGLASFGFIRPTPLAFENGNHGAKAKFRLSQLFYNFDFNCCTFAAETRTRKQRPTTNRGRSLLAPEPRREISFVADRRLQGFLPRFEAISSR